MLIDKNNFTFKIHVLWVLLVLVILCNVAMSATDTYTLSKLNISNKKTNNSYSESQHLLNVDLEELSITVKQPSNEVLRSSLKRNLNNVRFLQISSDDIKDINRRNTAINSGNLATTACLLIVSALCPGDPSYITSITLLKMLEYTKFLNIEYTSRIEFFFLTYKPVTGVINIPYLELPSMIKSKFTETSTPTIFEIFGLSSVFIINFWDDLIALSITFIIFLICYLIAFCAHRANSQSIASFVFRRLRVIVQNYAIGLFYIICMNIVMFASIQFQSVYFKSTPNILSFVAAVLFLVFIIIALSFHFVFIYKYRKYRVNTPTEDQAERLTLFRRSHKGVGVIFESFKTNSILRQGFLFVFVIRIIAFSLILTLCYTFPLLRIILVLAMDLLMFVYTIAARPFTTFINLLQQIIFEFALIGVHTCLLALAILDQTGKNTDYSLNKLSGLVMTFTIESSFCPLLFIILKAGMVVVSSCIKIRNNRRKRPVRSSDLTVGSNMSIIPIDRTEIEANTLYREHIPQGLFQNDKMNIVLPEGDNSERRQINSEDFSAAPESNNQDIPYPYNKDNGVKNVIKHYWINPGSEPKMPAEKSQEKLNSNQHIEISQIHLGSSSPVDHVPPEPQDEINSAKLTLKQLLGNKRSVKKRVNRIHHSEIHSNLVHEPSRLHEMVSNVFNSSVAHTELKIEPNLNLEEMKPSFDEVQSAVPKLTKFKRKAQIEVEDEIFVVE